MQQKCSSDSGQIESHGPEFPEILAVGFHLHLQAWQFMYGKWLNATLENTLQSLGWVERSMLAKRRYVETCLSHVLPFEERLTTMHAVSIKALWGSVKSQESDVQCIRSGLNDRRILHSSCAQ